MILITKPFSQGEYVDIDGTTGVVQHIDLLLTTMTTYDNKVVTIPNGRLILAIVQSRPDGVDLNSGVEDAPGLKNHGKMAAAEAAIRSASAELRTLHRSLGDRNGAGPAHE